ncbi:MAG: sulfatase-like hydrolase/transferase [bacterium]|nr:sulfatase-like hydrolase/transferase [bacterium]
MLKAAAADYQTAHFGKWDHRFDNVSPADMGYDASDGVTGNRTGGSKGTGGPAAREDPKLIFGITKRATDFMERQVEEGKPFFVQVSHYAVHLDIFYRQATLDLWQSHPRGRKHNMPEFAAMTRDMDEGIGLLLDKVEELGLWENTYVFFLSDNGGRNTIPGAGEPRMPRNHPLRDGKGSMYEGGVRVPFMVAGPGIEQGSVSRVPVTGLDIFPTLAELAGYEPDLPETVDGGSLVEVLHGGDEVSRRNPFLIFHHAVGRKPQTGLRQGNWKLVKTWQQGRVELFDLSKDLGEQRDLSKRVPEKTRELETLMEDFLQQVGAETRRTE